MTGDRAPQTWALLTAVEEVDLARAIEAGVLAQDRLTYVVDDPGLAADLACLVRLGREAHERMVLANLRLVRFWAARRLRAGAHGGLSLDDLVSEGTLGLLRAVLKFDFTRGVKFSTYASNWIRSFMGRAVARNTVVTVDEATRVALHQMFAADEELHSKLGRRPSTAEVAAAMRATVRHVEQLRQVAQFPLSLDAPSPGDRPGRTAGELLADRAGDCSRPVVQQDLTWRVRQLLRHLSDRERQVLSLRFGMGGDPHTVDETAAVLGVPEPMVRAALQGALSKLRVLDGVEGLHAFLEAA